MKDCLRLLILDACILIDFASSDRAVLQLVSDYIGQVHVAAPVFAEVEQLGEDDASALGLRIVTPPLDLAMDAAARKGALAFQDWLCVLMAKSNGWTCVSNDTRVRRECQTQGVDVLWGLELVAMLVEKDALQRDVARDIGKAIKAANSFITGAVLARFLQRIGVKD